jgi:hypothetical protein
MITTISVPSATRSLKKFLVGVAPGSTDGRGMMLEEETLGVENRGVEVPSVRGRGNDVLIADDRNEAVRTAALLESIGEVSVSVVDTRDEAEGDTVVVKLRGGGTVMVEVFVTTT